jgi:hypothetical protein
MQDQRSTDIAWLPDSDEVARIILGIVLQRHPGLVAIEELVRELAHPSLTQRIEEPLIQDGLTELVTNGLLYRLGSFVLVTRAAARAAELTG